MEITVPDKHGCGDNRQCSPVVSRYLRLMRSCVLLSCTNVFLCHLNSLVHFACSFFSFTYQVLHVTSTNRKLTIILYLNYPKIYQNVEEQVHSLFIIKSKNRFYRIYCIVSTHFEGRDELIYQRACHCLPFLHKIHITFLRSSNDR